MRPIKFRAWNVPTKQMFYWGTLQQINRTDPRNIEAKHNHFMQFTGLLDKNGKEIYESDIVTARHGRNDYEGYSIIKGEVKFENGQWVIGNYVMNYQNDNFEVIGNKYES